MIILRLERHQYAPELNRVELSNGKTSGWLKCPGVIDMGTIKERFKRREFAPFKHVTITKHYPRCHLLASENGQVVASGKMRSYDDVRCAMNMAKARLTDTGWLQIKIRLIEG
mgnify:CR=1 FL=1